MAIVQISKIQHRRGTNENLPQLASAELGWSIDTRQLYIGNGTIDEGAPRIGNTEILTEYSDLLSVAQAYTFKGQLAGYTAQTGTSVIAPIARSLQDKLDDFVNIRDFGAIGDGSADDTEAINRALRQIYLVNINQPLVRRTIYFPAGNYKISGDVIKIPSYASLRGDGLGRTIITQVDTAQQYTATIAKMPDDIEIPAYVDISDISFVNSVNGNVFHIDGANNLAFNRVAFSGTLASPLTSIINKSCMEVNSTTTLSANNISFIGCKFSNLTYAVSVNDDETKGINFHDCSFTDLYQGFKIEKPLDGVGPTGIRIMNSYFDRITRSAIVSNVPNVVSAFNYYGDVGNDLSGAETPIAPIIDFGSYGCYSFGDYFSRTDASDIVFPRISDGNLASVTVIPLDAIKYGTRKLGVGGEVELVAGLTGNTTISLGSVTRGATINYSITRNTAQRNGVMVISNNINGVVSYTDDYTETADPEVTLFANVSGNVVTVWHTTTTGINPTLKYSIDRFN